MAKFGIDVSRWQPGFDFERAKAEGVEFVIIKCSQEDFTDSQFERHYKAAKVAGLGVGAYHYLKANNVTDAVKEAEYCLKAIAGKQFEYPIYLDFEEACYTKNSKEKNEKIIRAFCDKVEAAGYWVGVYTNLNYYKNYLDGAVIARRYTLWLAAWAEKMPIDAPMWQFGGETNKIRSNKVAGVVCDQNYCYVDFPKAIKERGLNGFGKYFNYTVKKGESLWSIAQKFLGEGKRYTEIKEFNGLTEDTIHPNQVLKIPGEKPIEENKVDKVAKEVIKMIEAAGCDCSEVIKRVNELL